MASEKYPWEELESLEKRVKEAMKVFLAEKDEKIAEAALSFIKRNIKDGEGWKYIQ